MNVKNVAIFASGAGTNAQKIIDRFQHSTTIKIALIVSNKPAANVLNVAKNAGIDTLVLSRTSFYDSAETIHKLKEAKIDLIVLAGFLWMIPESLVKAFPDQIINIHPSLLPKFGGKGMYGMHVHNAVIGAKENKSGISIHYVNEYYDKGEIIAQYSCAVEQSDTAETLAEKIHQLEYTHFSDAIENLLTQK